MAAHGAISLMQPDLGRVRHVVLDMDGTIYKGSRLFPCTLPFLEQLRSAGIGYTFITNNTSKSKRDYVDRLHTLGIAIDESQIYTPADSAIVYLRERLTGIGSIAVLGTPSLRAQFEQAGFTVTWDTPQAVVVGFDTTLDYQRLCRAAYWISHGLPFVATHPDLICPTDEPTVLVDCGAICAALTAATGQTPVVLGKPDPSILRDLCASLSLTCADIAMVGDRLYTDMALARAAGALGVLVLTGEATMNDVAASPIQPDLIVADVGELGHRLLAARKTLQP